MGIKKASPKKESKIKFQLDQDIWPIERDILCRPARLKYVRKIIKPKGCVFCVHSKSKDSLQVFKTKYSQIVVNKFPYNSGHLLILPLRHCESLLKLSDEEYIDLHGALKMAMEAIEYLYQPHGFNIGLNHGKTAGAGIPDHLHYHIVPRWNGDLNFFPLIAETKLVVEESKKTFKRFKKYFSSKKLKGMKI